MTGRKDPAICQSHQHASAHRNSCALPADLADFVRKSSPVCRGRLVLTEGQSRSKTVGKEVNCWGKMGEVSGLSDLKTSSELKERGQALWHGGKWAMSNAALCSLLPLCFNSA